MIRRTFIKLLAPINTVLIIITIILLGSLVVFGISTVITDSISISLSADGVLSFQDFWSECGLIIKAFIAILTLTIASIQLKRYIDLETTSTLAKLREMLTSDINMEIHHLIQNNQCFKKCPINSTTHIIRDVDVYNYLGTLELGAIMVKRETITMGEFANQFGYRIEAVMNNCSVFTKYIQDEREYYQDLIQIWTELQQYYSKRK